MAFWKPALSRLKTIARRADALLLAALNALPSPLQTFRAGVLVGAFILFVASIFLADRIADPVNAYIMGLSALITSIIAISVLVFHRMSNMWTLIVSLYHMFMCNFTLSNIHVVNGLIIGGELGDIDFMDGFYFSVVTWTTLGYGDFTPNNSFRMLSAAHALCGYIYLGLFVGLIARNGSATGTQQ